MLLQVKEQLGHGTFGRWVEENCRISEQRGRKYMQLARAVHAGELDLEEVKRRPAAVSTIEAILARRRRPGTE
jgi:hypothetical protein